MSDAPITPLFQEKAPVIMRDLMAVLPLSDEDAAATLGSFGVETGGFTLREESNGVGYGWAQWSGERREDFEIWCIAADLDPYNGGDEEYDAACFGFFVYEVTQTWEKRVLTEGGTINGVFYPPLCNCGTLDSKTESFWRLYERPGTPHEDWRREMAHEALRLYRGGKAMPYNRIVISSGHGLKVRGAHGILDEVDEARRVTEHLADELRLRGVDVVTYHDDVSTSQNENLNRIADFHNSQTRDLDISVHFNAYEQVEKPMGTEVLYVTQSQLAASLSEAIASVGFIDRGPKKRTDLFFLNNTEMPAVLLEVCFVDSEADAELYSETFDDICTALADELGGVMTGGEELPPPIEELPPPTYVVPRIEIEVEGDVIIVVNGQQIT